MTTRAGDRLKNARDEFRTWACCLGYRIHVERHEAIAAFFEVWACELSRVPVPCAHVLIASNPLLSQTVGTTVHRDWFERRGEVIRLPAPHLVRPTLWRRHSFIANASGRREDRESSPPETAGTSPASGSRGASAAVWTKTGTIFWGGACPFVRSKIVLPLRINSE